MRKKNQFVLQVVDTSLKGLDIHLYTVESNDYFTILDVFKRMKSVLSASHHSGFLLIRRNGFILKSSTYGHI